jgi:hypothetical protein
MKKVDFRAIEIENIAGEVEKVDLAKVLGNAMFGQAKTFEVVELARKIWKDGEVELTAEDVKILEEQIPNIFPTYVVKTALLNAIK